MENSLKAKRLKIGLSRRKLAEEVGITEVAIFNYENNIRTPRTSISYRLIDAFKKRGVTLRFEDIYPRN